MMKVYAYMNGVKFILLKFHSVASITDTMPINPSASNRKEEVTELIKVGFYGYFRPKIPSLEDRLGPGDFVFRP